MKKIIRLSVLFTAMFFVACDSNDSSTVATGTGATRVEAKNLITINDNVSALNKRMQLVGQNTGRSLSGRAIAEENSVFLNEIGTYVNGAADIQATHVAVRGNFAYVAYATKGELYGGTIDVINFTDINNPVVEKQAIVDADIISLAVSGNQLIIAAAADIKAPTTVFGNSSIVINMTLGSDNLLSTNYVVTEVEGDITTDVAADDAYYYVTTGANGSIFKFSLATNEFVSRLSRPDLRSVAVNGSKLATLSGAEGINFWNNAATVINFTKNVDGSAVDNVTGAKRTLAFTTDATNLLVAQGAEGLGVYNTTSYDKVQTLAIPAGGENNVTNGVSVESNYAFTANGAAGVYVYKVGTGNLPLTKVGNITLAGSANYVKAAGDVLFVASGTEGLKIVKKQDSSL